jgi:hypothetical protein
MSTLAERIIDDAEKFTDPTLLGVAATYYAASTLLHNDHNEVLTTDAGEPLQIDGATGTSINVLFFEAYEMVDQFGAVQDTAPAAIARTIDVPNAQKNDYLRISGTDYHAIRVQDDGAGNTLIMLSRRAQ